MLRKRTFMGLLCLLFVYGIAVGAKGEISAVEKQEFQQDMARIRAVEKNLSPGEENSLADFAQFADGLQSKWWSKSKELYARVVIALCGPLSSGRFQDDRRYELARRYALSVLAKPGEVSADTELELTGHVETLMIGPHAPKGQAWEQARRTDVEVRLHAWRRLLDSIDPRWDPNEVILSPNAVTPPAATGLPGGVDPNAIADPVLRAEYEQALAANQRKIEAYNEQYKLHKWLKRYPKRAEEYIVQAYSVAPYNNEELTSLLNKYGLDDETKARILAAVAKNIASKG
jgi:hypothetical protein